MSVLIKGLTKEKVESCFRFAKDGWCIFDMPEIVEVPEHGRLIDADALMLKILDYIEEYSDVDDKGWHNLKWCAMKEAEMAIKDAPTIIPAEPQKEET